MKIRQLWRFGAASVLSLSSLLLITMPNAFAGTGIYFEWTGGDSASAGLAGCTSNCWSNFGNWEVSTDGGVTYNPATSGQVPNNLDNSGLGDNIVFDATSLTSAQTVTNDISGLAVSSLTFSGTNAGFDGYVVAGSAITLNGDITDSSPDAEIDTALVLGGDVTVTGSGANNFYTSFGSTSTSSTIDTQGHMLTFTDDTGGGADGVYVNDGLVGSGSVVVNKTNAGVSFNGDSSTYTGAVSATSGVVGVNTVTALGNTSGVTIGSGASLGLGSGVNGTTYNFPVSLSGSGATSETTVFTEQNIVWGRGGGGATPVITFSGPVTLNTDVVYSGSSNLDITGTYTTNGHSFTNQSGSIGTVIIGTPAAAATTTPKTPDTGLAAVVGSPAMVISTTAAAAFALLVVARRLQVAKK